MEKKKEFVTLNINSSKIVFTLLAIFIALVLASVITQAIRFLVLNPELYRFSRFNLDAEANIPTYFSTLILLFASVLLSMIAFFKKKDKDPYRIYWIILSLIFFAMSIDETAALHEMMIKPLRSLLNVGGFFYYTWVIPAAVFFVIFVIMFIKFWLHLRLDIKMLFAFSALFYISGALGFECIGGFYRELNGEMNFSYNLITTVEEILELIGSILFIYSLLRYLRSFYPHMGVQINFR